MSKHVHGGQTFTTGGTLAAGQTLIGLTGNPGALIITEARAVNDGTIILDGSSKPRLDGATLRDIGVLTNVGTIDVGAGAYPTRAALLDIAGVLNNIGTIEAAAGSYIYTQGGGGGAGGQVRIDATGTLNNSGTLTLQTDAAANYSTDATLADNGVLTNAASGTINIDGKGLFSYGGPATLLVSGALQNSGMIIVGDYGNSGIVADNGLALLADSGNLTNSGIITVESCGGDFNGGDSSTLEVSGTLVNLGEIILQYGGGYYDQGPGALLLDTGSVDNTGTILLEGYGDFFAGASFAVTGVLTNTGTVLVQPGANIAVSGTATSEGSIALYGGASSGYSGAGRYFPGLGGLLTVTGVMTNTGTIAFGGGLTTPSFGEYGGYGGYGAELAVTGVMQNYGVLAVDGGTGSVPDFPRLPYIATGRGATISLRGDLLNSGTITLQQASASSYGLYGTGAAFIDNGFLQIDSRGLIMVDGGIGTAAGTLTIGAAGTLDAEGGTIAGGGVLVNQGLIEESGTSITGVTFTNDGLVEASFETVINSAVAADAGKTGLFSIFGGTLDLGGAVAASQTVAFYASFKDTLALGDAPAFDGTLSGLAAGDAIDFLKLDVTSASTSGDILAIGLSSGTTLDLALATPLVGVSLNLQRDGNHGTDLVLTASNQGHF